MKKSVQILLCVFCFSLIFAIVLNPKECVTSCLQGFLVFGKNVLPALFPFFFLTQILSHINGLTRLSAKFSGVTKKLFNTSGISAYIFLMSVISGYPMGAKLTAEFYSRGLIDKNEASRICTFCTTSGPMFIIGTVGVGLLFSFKIGILVFISHVISSILNGLIYRSYKARGFTPRPLNFSSSEEHNLLSTCMYNAMQSALIVGGFIAFAYLLIDVLVKIGILSLAISLFGKGITTGLLEVTRGCLELGKSGLPALSTTMIASGLISFGGFSIHMQNLVFLRQANVSTNFYFLQKITHTILSVGISFVLGMLFL